MLSQLAGTGFQVLFHSPPGVLFTFPSQYYALSVTKEYLALRGGPRSFRQGFTCLVLLWILSRFSRFRIRGFHSLWPCLSMQVLLAASIDYTVRTPRSKLPGLGSSAFARRYLRNHGCFLFLRLLRCFSSPGSLRMTMDSSYGDGGLCSRVAPFRYLRVKRLFASNRSFSQLITSFIGS